MQILHKSRITYFKCKKLTRVIWLYLFQMFWASRKGLAMPGPQSFGIKLIMDHITEEYRLQTVENSVYCMSLALHIIMQKIQFAWTEI